MRVHIYKFVAFILILCLAAPFFSAVASAAVVVTHTHVCHEDEQKEVCTDVRECCTACPNFYDGKYRFQNSYGNVSKFSYTYILSSGRAATGISFACEETATLVSLKVRLNN